MQQSSRPKPRRERGQRKRRAEREGTLLLPREPVCRSGPLGAEETRCVPGPLSAPSALRSHQDGGPGCPPGALTAGTGSPQTASLTRPQREPAGAAGSAEHRLGAAPSAQNRVSGRAVGGSRCEWPPGPAFPAALTPRAPPRLSASLPQATGARVFVGKGLPGTPLLPVELVPGHVRHRDPLSLGPARRRTGKHCPGLWCWWDASHTHTRIARNTG